MGKTYVTGAPKLIETDEPIHDYFGLSYASYLVMPRVVLQSMPVEWQRQITELLREIEETLGDWNDNGTYYKVTKLTEDGGALVEDDLQYYERGRRRLRKYHKVKKEDIPCRYKDVFCEKEPLSL